jgi:hypothetical protein
MICIDERTSVVTDTPAAAHSAEALPENLATLFARAESLREALDAPLSAVTDVPKPEHPRPQLHRPAWLNLNGTWQFETDRGDSGRERGVLDRELSGQITVPFAPETEASGIGDRDFLEAVWYRREIEIPADWEGLRPVLHFGAVDHDATVWVEGTEVARHRGGYTPFDADLSEVASAGQKVTVVVRARDSKDAPQARGKQSLWYGASAATYHRTTGIWQTVWLEGVPVDAVDSLRVIPSLASHSFAIDTRLTRNVPGAHVEIVASVPGEDGAEVARAQAPADLDLSPHTELVIPEDAVRVWGPGEPELYALVVRLVAADGSVIDEVRSYAGLRSTTLSGKEFRINGKKVFQRLVLDQGYWEDTFTTAPSDAAINEDIHLSFEAGFNGARLHQKVFEERMLFFSDLHGYLTWGEFGDWGVNGYGLPGDNQQPTASFVAQWVEALGRDMNHPSIVGWCPLNETHQLLHDRITVLDDVTRAMYDATKLADPSRPVLDASGYSHRVPGADVYDSHSYEQDPERFRVEQSGLAEGTPFANDRPEEAGRVPFADGSFSVAYEGQPYFVSEYGGIWWNEEEARRAAEEAGNNASESWGYGQRIASEEELYERFEGLTRVLLEDPDMFAYCYTQLTDVFQEKNGVVDFHRGRKLDLARLRAVQEKTAAYEQGE